MKIAIVDDDAALLASLGSLLRSEGHEVLCFDNGLEAFWLLADDNPVDLLIVDNIMPHGIDGDMLLQHLPDRNYPVIMVTGYPEDAKQLDLAGLGVSALLPKPLDLDQLRKAIAQPGKAAE